MKKTRGFTLIELLVVISIIAILATIMMPALGYAKKLARRSACMGQLRSVAVAMRMYLNNSDDVMPNATMMLSQETGTDPAIADVLADYMDSPNTLKCPADILGNYYEIDRDTDKLKPIERSKTYFETEKSSYAYNSMLSGQRVQDSFLTARFNVPEGRIYVLTDYTAYHGSPGTPGAANYLFADCHVGDFE